VSSPTIAKSQLVIDFITGLGWDVTQESGYPLYPGPEILVAPDKLVTVTPVTGPGYTTEEAGLDNWGFQVRLRGAADDPLGPELAIQRLDYMILAADYPATVDGVRIALAYRMGASPTPLPLNPSDRRFEYTCTYLLISQTGG
jgi:hypothetical protein